MTDKKTNTGNRSTGNRSTGDFSTGNCSTGDFSTGNCSTGDFSTGDFSTGDFSTGDFSTGNRSTGDFSTGNCSTGNCSTGDFSTGYCSTGNYSVGHFCTKDYAPHGWFNAPSTIQWSDIVTPDFYDFYLTKWIPESEMTDQEKIDNPRFNITEGYLKKFEYKQAWANFWAVTPEENKKKFLALPNFDAKIFEEITGINVNQKPDCEGKEVLIEGVKYILRKA